MSLHLKNSQASAPTSISKETPQMVKSHFWNRIRQRFWMVYHYFFGYHRIPKMLYGFTFSQTLYVAVKLGIADHLSECPKNCEELATELDVNVNALCHLMKVLAKLGIVRVNKKGLYQLTALGSYLQSNTPNSLQGTVLSIGETYPVWGNLLYSIQSGKEAFKKTFHQEIYDYLGKNPASNAHFNRWMEETTRDWIIPTLDICELSQVKTVVDVGGSTGTLIAMILKRYPHLQGILFDQEHVVSGAPKILEAAQVTDRCQVVGGSFFDSIPTGGEIYIISRVLLNWDDTKALNILKNCRAAMNDSARLLIIDFVLSKKGMSTYELMGSFQMFVIGSGHLMRTDDEYYHLLLEAGFQSPQLIKTGGSLSFIEAVPG